MLFLAHLRPPQRSVDCRFDLLARGGGRRAFIKAHDHIRTQLVLDFHGFTRTQKVRIPVHMGAKVHARIGDRAQALEGKDLKSSGVREDRLFPVDEVMQTACLRNGVFAGMQVQMVGVAEEDLCPKIMKILVRDSAHGTGRAHGHEERCVYDTMSGGECTAAAEGGFTQELEHDG